MNREQIQGRCRHHNGTRDNIHCKAGVQYNDVMRLEELGMEGCMLRLPCSGDPVGMETRGHKVQPCDKYSPLTEEEIAAKIKMWDEHMDLIKANKSTCCGADIDESRVITEGSHKGHGPRLFAGH